MDRRRFLGASLAGLATSLVAPGASALECGGLTAPNIEGPFYRPGAPAREALGEAWHLAIGGRVMDASCRPLGHTTIEVWQANADGEYDRTGDDFRGVLRTDSGGRYRLMTVTPGRYLNGPSYRPAHIHMKVHATGRPVLTTQLYFPGDPYNERDPWFRDSLLLRMAPMGCGQIQHASFDFVV